MEIYFYHLFEIPWLFHYTWKVLTDPHPFNRPIADPRWLGTSIVIQGTYLPQAADQDYVWRRIQVSQVQAEKQRKSVLQLAMVFHARTAKLMQDFGAITQPILFSMLCAKLWRIVDELMGVPTL